MTREELKQKHLNEENEKINGLKGKTLNQEEKNWFRKTHAWNNFRKTFEVDSYKELKNGKKKPIKAMDYLTQNPLKKGYQLHHMDLNSEHYTELIRDHFIPLNPQSHDTLHWAYTQMCKDKDFVNRFVELLNKMYEINDGKDVKDFK